MRNKQILKEVFLLMETTITENDLFAKFEAFIDSKESEDAFVDFLVDTLLHKIVETNPKEFTDYKKYFWD